MPEFLSPLPYVTLSHTASRQTPILLDHDNREES